LVNLGDVARPIHHYRHGQGNEDTERRIGMYVVVQHSFIDPSVAFARGDRLIKIEGAPAGARVLQFYPASDGSRATCLWESPTVDAIQGYVDETLGDSSTNLCYEVEAEQAFAKQPLGLRESPPILA
jgi:hypothetical protein